MSVYGRTPRFSLVLPAYNAMVTLQRCVDSVLAQSFQSWELIIVDDGSADQTGRIAARYSQVEPRVRVLTQLTNTGCAAARRAGAELARGEFVTKVDADDYLLPGALETLSAAIDAEPGYDIYSAHGYREFSDGTRLDVFGDPRFRKPLSLTLSDLIEECWIFGGAASIRREVLERVGGFRAEMRCEDYDLWLRALAAGATHRFVPQHLYVWSMGIPGRMNEDPRRSFQSYIVILNDLVDRGILTGEYAGQANRSIARFEERIRQLSESGSTDADYTNEQALRFTRSVRRLLGDRLGDVVIAWADRVKWIVRPVRVRIARRRRLKSGERP